MDLHDYDYIAENYDLYLNALLGGNDDGVIDFHLHLAAQYGAGGIIDIACGTGLTMLPLLEAGYHVTGLDISAAMIDVVARKLDSKPAGVKARAALLFANMTDFGLPRPCSLAIIPRSGFMHLLTSEDQESALKTIACALTPGGIFSFNTFDPNYEIIAANRSGQPVTPFLRTEYTNARGNHERIWNQTEYNPLTQRIEAGWIFEELDGSGQTIARREYPLHMRWSFEPELRHLLRLCGFTVLEVYGSYHRAPCTYGGQRVWVTQKAV